MHRFPRTALLLAVIALVATGAVACKSSEKSGQPAASTKAASTSVTKTPASRATPKATTSSGTSGAFDSYHYTVTLDFRVDDPNQPESSLIKGQVEGDFVAPDSHAFASTFQVASLSYGEQAVIIGEDAWYKESSSEWRATTRSDPDVQSALSLTSADPGFLQDAEFSNNLSNLESEPDTINGVETRRYFIPKEAVEALSQLLGASFLQDASGLKDFEMTVWLERQTQSLVRAQLVATAGPEVFGTDSPFDVSPDSTVSINMTINLTNINDEAISIGPPI